jgi:hypothetical protein
MCIQTGYNLAGHRIGPFSLIFWPFVLLWRFAVQLLNKLVTHQGFMNYKSKWADFTLIMNPPFLAS